MNVSTVKWAQRDKTQSRELLGLFVCVCVSLCTTVDLIIFPHTLKTITIALMVSIINSHNGQHLKIMCTVLALFTLESKHMSSSSVQGCAYTL